MKTLEQILAEEKTAQAEYEAKTIGYGGFYISELRAAFDKVQNPINWKLGNAAIVEPKDLPIVQAAVIHYHGQKGRVLYTEPVTNRVVFQFDGYIG